MSLYSLFIIIHIIAGTTGLVSGTLATIVSKGSRIHKRIGFLFFIAMVTVAISAWAICFIPNHGSSFLFAVGGFTFYMASSGYRIVQLKRVEKIANASSAIKTIDYALLVFIMLFGIYLFTTGILQLIKGNNFGAVSLVFGSICGFYTWQDLPLITKKVSAKQIWITNHISRMMGALIASYTAFLVVNVQIKQQWILWLLPTAIGVMLIIKFIREYTPKKGNKLQTSF